MEPDTIIRGPDERPAFAMEVDIMDGVVMEGDVFIGTARTHKPRGGESARPRRRVK